MVQRNSFSFRLWLEGLQLERALFLRFILPEIQGDSLRKVGDSDLSLCLQLEYGRQAVSYKIVVEMLTKAFPHLVDPSERLMILAEATSKHLFLNSVVYFKFLF